MKINQVEELVGITKKNIRFYEDQGLLNPSRNPENGYRDYNLDDVSTLMKIKLLRKLSLPIEEIRQLQNHTISFDTCMERQVLRLNHEQHDIEIMKTLCRNLSKDVSDLSELDAAKYLSDMQQREAGGAKFVDIEKKDVKKKKYGSLIAAIVVITFMLVMIGFIIWAKIQAAIPGPVFILMLFIYAIVIICIIIVLKQRLSEINGGEEDEARKY